MEFSSILVSARHYASALLGDLPHDVFLWSLRFDVR
jgi:hypothetical protein